MQRWFRRASSAVRRLALLLLLAAAAWVASNGPWADASPQPLAAQLALRPMRLAAERNAFVDLQGMDAPQGDEINAAGQAALRGVQPDRATRLDWPSGSRWQCRPTEHDCITLWRSEAEALRTELAGAAVLGRRCEQLADVAALEEALMERPASGPLASAPWAALPIPRYAALSNCTRWLAMRAALENDPILAQRWLARADHFARLALQGSRSLIGTMVGVAVVQNNWLLAAQRVAAGGMDRTMLTPLLAPLPDGALSPRHWAPEEARFSRELMRDMGDQLRGCGRAVAEDDEPWPLSLESLFCRLQLGVLPEQSAQDVDAGWLARLAGLPSSGPVDCETLQAPSWREASRVWPRWRNTLARFAIDTPGPNWGPYAARQVDLELLRQTLLALSRGQPTPAGVMLQREGGALRFSACRALLQPQKKAATLRLPLL